MICNQVLNKMFLCLRWIQFWMAKDYTEIVWDHFDISFLVESPLNHLSGCCSPFAPKFWEVAWTKKWWFHTKMNTDSVVETNKCGGDTQTLLAVWKKSNFMQSQINGDAKSSGASPLWATWWNFYYLILKIYEYYVKFGNYSTHDFLAKHLSISR